MVLDFRGFFGDMKESWEQSENNMIYRLFQGTCLNGPQNQFQRSPANILSCFRPCDEQLQCV